MRPETTFSQRVRAQSGRLIYASKLARFLIVKVRVELHRTRSHCSSLWVWRLRILQLRSIYTKGRANCRRAPGLSFHNLEECPNSVGASLRGRPNLREGLV